VVYKVNIRGPRTEPCGTPHIQKWQEEKLLLHLTREERDDKYDLNQSQWFKPVSSRALNAEPKWQTSEQYVVIKGIKSCRDVEKTKTRYFLWAYSINKMILNVEQSSCSGVVLNVSRLVGIKEIIGSTLRCSVSRDLTTRSMILDTRYFVAKYIARCSTYSCTNISAIFWCAS